MSGGVIYFVWEYFCGKRNPVEVGVGWKSTGRNRGVTHGASWEDSQKARDVGRERRSETDEDGWFDDWFDLGSFEDEDDENSASGDPFAPNHQVEVVELSDVDGDWAEETSRKRTKSRRRTGSASGLAGGGG